MSLNAVTAALYQNRDGKHVVSHSTLTSDGVDSIAMSSTKKIELGSNLTHGASEALRKVLELIAGHQTQIVNLVGDQAMLVPLPVVYGTSERHDKAAYISWIKRSFPEFFRAVKGVRLDSVNDHLGHVIASYHQANRAVGTDDEPSSEIALQPYTLFLPEDETRSVASVPSQAEMQIGERLNALVTQAEQGIVQAQQQLAQLAAQEGRSYAEDLRSRGILDSTRFVQFGVQSDAFRACGRYTYLRYGNLKDVFVRAVISQFSAQHNVAMKTPLDTAAPPFVDIAGTFLSDAWMQIEYLRTNKLQAFKNTVVSVG